MKTKKILSTFISIIILGNYTLIASANDFIVNMQSVDISVSQSQSENSYMDGAEYAGNIYQYFDDEISWEEAKNACENMGGHLATITSVEEHKFIKSLINDCTKDYYWLGGTDQEEEGVWKWVTGEGFAYENWSINNPDNFHYPQFGYENYLGIVINSDFGAEKGEWNDYSIINDYCSHGYICEWEEKALNNKNHITVFLNGSQILVEHPAILEEGRILVPIEAICEAMGATVDWNESEQTVTATRGDKVLTLTLGSDKAKIRDKTYYLEVPPKMINELGFVPIDFIVSGFEAYVEWNSDSQTVEVMDNSSAMLTSRVKEYTSTIDSVRLSELTQGNLDDAQILELRNMLNKYSPDKRWKLEALLTDDIYVAEQFKRYIDNNLAASSALNIGAFVFKSEATDYIVGKWPEKEKYKVMLKQYITKTENTFESMAYADELCSLAEAIKDAANELGTANVINYSKQIDGMLATIRNTPTDKIGEVCDTTLSKIKAMLKSETQLNVISDSSFLSHALSTTGKLLKVANITSDTVQSYLFASKNAKVYDNYAHIFDAIRSDESTLPIALRAAANEIRTELLGDYSTIMEKSSKDIAGVIVDDTVDVSKLSASAVLTQISIGLEIGTFIGNTFFGVSDMTDGAAYTMGYAYLSKFYAQRLAVEKADYSENYRRSYNDAVKAASDFMRDYETLRILRIAGEQSYLDMCSFDKVFLLKDVLQSWTDFQEKQDFGSDNINRLKSEGFI